MRMHFSGIGGSGMSALAQLYAWEGHAVSGSDRAHDRVEAPERFGCLSEQGIRLFPEDGSGVSPDCDVLILSAAIESSHPDLHAARRQGVRTQLRSELLAERLNASKSIAVVGTSGKSTTASLIAYILSHAGWDPEAILGAEVPALPGAKGLCNARPGQSGWIVAEVDESDGTIDLVKPTLSVFTSVSKDHKAMEEVLESFNGLAKRTSEKIIYHAGDPHLRALFAGLNEATSYALSEGASWVPELARPKRWRTELRVRGLSTILLVPGAFNVLNALASLACVTEMGLGLDRSLEALASFPGLTRRMERVGSANGIEVVDDFAHNPEKVKASLSFLTANSERLFVLFQPHGFRPTAFFKAELVQAFAEGLRHSDRLFVAPIYYVGGTADRCVSSKEIADEVRRLGSDAVALDRRDQFPEEACRQAKPGDIIAVLGARDPTLPGFARQILARLSDN